MSDEIEFDQPGSFTLNITGEITSKNYSGVFKVRKLLTHFQQLEENRLYREYLGSTNPDQAPVAIKNTAFMLASLSVRVVDAPSWYRDSDGGRSLVDDTVLMEIYNRTVKVETNFKEEVAKKLEADKKALAAASK